MSFTILNFLQDWPNVEKIATDFPNLTIELFTGDVDQVLKPIYEENLIDGYAKTLKGDPPEFVNLDSFLYDASAKTYRNQAVVARAEEKIAENSTEPFSVYRLFYLVSLEGKPIGTLEIYTDGPRAVQYGIFTDRAHSHKGIGAAVINAASQMLRKNTNIKQVFYECDADNVASNKLALKTGFVFEHEFFISSNRKANRYALELFPQ